MSSVQNYSGNRTYPKKHRRPTDISSKPKESSERSSWGPFTDLVQGNGLANISWCGLWPSTKGEKAGDRNQNPDSYYPIVLVSNSFSSWCFEQSFSNYGKFHYPERHLLYLEWLTRKMYDECETMVFPKCTSILCQHQIDKKPVIMIGEIRDSGGKRCEWLFSLTLCVLLSICRAPCNCRSVYCSSIQTFDKNANDSHNRPLCSLEMTVMWACQK